MELTWLGHASIKIVSNHLTILIDPYDCKVEKADLILLTHDHYDHFSQKLIDEASFDETHLFGPEKTMNNLNGQVMSPGKIVEIPGITLEAVYAYNVKKTYHPRGEGIGYILSLEGKRIYIAGDTDLIPEMNAVECDVALLPIGGTYTMDATEAASAAIILAPEIVIPVHYGKVVGNFDDAVHFKEEIEKNHGEILVKILKVNETINL